MTTTPRPTYRRLSPRQPVRRVVVLLLLAVAGAAACTPSGGNDVDRATAPAGTRHPDVTVTVPAAGASSTDSVARLPNPLRVHVGQTLRIRNTGATATQVGPFLVDANTTVTQRFLRPGRLEGTCVGHPDGRLVIDVRA